MSQAAPNPRDFPQDARQQTREWDAIAGFDAELVDADRIPDADTFPLLQAYRGTADHVGQPGHNGQRDGFERRGSADGPTGPQLAGGARNADGGQRAPHPRHPFAQRTPLGDRIGHRADVRGDDEAPDHETPAVRPQHGQHRGQGSEPRRVGTDTSEYPALPRPPRPARRPTSRGSDGGRVTPAQAETGQRAQQVRTGGEQSPPWEDDEEDQRIDQRPTAPLPIARAPQPRVDRLIRLRHGAGANLARVGVGLAHGPEAGRQAHDQVLARGEAARREADAHVGEHWANIRRSAAARWAGMMALAGGWNTGSGRYRTERQRHAHLNHIDMVNRMGGNYAYPFPDTRPGGEHDPHRQSDQATDPRDPIILSSPVSLPHEHRDRIRAGLANGTILHRIGGDGGHEFYQRMRLGEADEPHPQQGRSEGAEGGRPEGQPDDTAQRLLAAPSARAQSEAAARDDRPEWMPQDGGRQFYLGRARLELNDLVRQLGQPTRAQAEQWMEQRARQMYDNDRASGYPRLREQYERMLEAQRQDPAYQRRLAVERNAAQRHEAAQREAALASSTDPDVIEARRLFARDKHLIPDDQQPGWVERTRASLASQRELDREAAERARRAREEQQARDLAYERAYVLRRANGIADMFGAQMGAKRATFPPETERETMLAALDAAEEFVADAEANNRRLWQARHLDQLRQQIVRAAATTIVREGITPTESRLLAGAFARELFGMQLDIGTR